MKFVKATIVLSLAFLGGAAFGQEVPGYVIVNSGHGVTLITSTLPNSYPPPVVVVDGCLVHEETPCSPGQNALVAIGAGGEIVALDGGEPHAPMVLLNGEIASPGEVDCDLASGHPQCRTLAWLGGSVNAESQGVPMSPGIVIVILGLGSTLVTDTHPNSYPPPVVVVNTCPVNSDPGHPNCPPGSNSLAVIGVSEETAVSVNVSSGPQEPSGIVEVVPSAGAMLHHGIAPSGYPPPVVIVDGVVVNLPALVQNSVQAIDANGNLLVFHGGQGESQMPIVLLGDEVLHPGGTDCGLVPGHPQCLAMEYVF